MAYSLLVDPGTACDGDVLENIATTAQRTLATVEFVESECVIPGTVDLNEVFDIKITYRLATIEKRNFNGILGHFIFTYDGGFYKTYSAFPLYYIQFWVWYLLQWSLYVLKGVNNPAYVLDSTHSRSTLGQKLVWNFHGTISQLLGEQVQAGDSVQVGWAISGRNIGNYTPSDLWPYEWNLLQSFDGPCKGGAQLTKTINVNLTPTPPYPLFDPDGCSVSKESVQPNEPFTIKSTIVNQNQYSGAYSIDIICLGNRTNLATGTIDGNATLIKSKTVTINQLAGQEITDDRMVDVEIAVSNSDGEKDRLGWQIAVFVIDGDGEMGNLSGTVKDNKGLALAGVSITTVGRTETTDSSGYYTFGALTIGHYSVEFIKSGYWPLTKEIDVEVGGSTLDVSLTPTTEPEPSEIPWKWIGVGCLAVAGSAFIIKGLAGKKGA